MLVSLVGLPATGKEYGVREFNRKGGLAIPSSRSKVEYQHFVETALRPLKTKSEVAPILAVLDPIPSDRPLTSEEQEAFSKAVSATLDNVRAGTIAVSTFVLLSLLGLIYLAYAVVIR